MMRGYKWGWLLMVLPYWAPMAMADSAASGVAAPVKVPSVRNPAVAATVANGVAAPPRPVYPVAASAVGPAPSPEEDYQAAIKADQAENLVDAGRLYMRAAQRGHAAAQARVAYGLRYAGADKEAFEWFRKAAEQGNAFGQMGLSTMYAESGVPGTQDFAEARKWLSLAADQGEKNAISMMANTYIVGGMGLDDNARNSPEALAWIKRATDIDDPAALKALASAYRSGQYGLAVDTKQADELDAKAKKILGIVDKKKKKTR